jgi:threonine synthase
MIYYSTRDKQKQAGVSFAQAVLQGLAPDGGLYLPEKIPTLPDSFFQNITEYSNEDIAYEIAQAYVQEEIPEKELRKIVAETINFPLPVSKIREGCYSLELYHGPTMAFKDVGARFMARVMAYFIRTQLHREVKVVVATSGDTGSAVAAGFFGIEGITVHILYPKGKVSPLQEKQLTTWGSNIHAIEVEGSFDDCQKIAKQLLSDEDIKKTHFLTSANSINIARLIPQSFYYALAWKQLIPLGQPVTFCVPSGNFGNLSAGIMLRLMGLPIRGFIAATNANHVFPDYLHSGNYQPQPSVPTLSNAMDVGAPSNFERMLNFYDHSVDAFRNMIRSVSVSDTETADTLRKVYHETGYLLDPHGAVGYSAIEKLHLPSEGIAVVLETAHPAKFVEVVEEILQQKIDVPQRLLDYAQKTKVADSVAADYDVVKQLIAQ